ncbi:hypothetical protein [Mycobacteroides abscessus]|uniref:hypothetical protein n=1 Tax=Mycobacteroides abscessus TaxID=36809 RepID=UPI000D3ED00C|nr:hypothetical protein [Mycobacteroides abscessus]PVB33039.1 hypothetical protein DDJ45_10425 [Mycobacteroides abscessus]
MSEIVRSLTRTPLQVWDFLMEPRLWGLKLTGFKPVLSNRFVMEHYSILGTNYTGECRCEIRSLIPERLLEFSMEPIGDATRPRPTRWVLRFEINAYLAGSSVVVKIFGVDSSRRSERILLHVTRSFVDAQLSKLSDSTKYGNRIGRTPNCRGELGIAPGPVGLNWSGALCDWGV